jgi:predicted dehydrogenase
MIAQLPSEKRPIYIIGAGGIVNDAHLPAYKIAGYNVQGIFDINEAKAKKTAAAFSIPQYIFQFDTNAASCTSQCSF